MGDFDICPQTEGRFAGDGKGDNLWDYWYQVEPHRFRFQEGPGLTSTFYENWEEDDDTDYCTAAADLADAQAVCDKLEIKLHKINFAAEYWDNVFEHFLTEYKAGRTPNPDILCNKEIKFKAFLEYAAEDLGAHYIATGHYVRRAGDDENAKLLRGFRC